MTVAYTNPTRIRLAGLLGLINGVQTAFPNIPRILQDAELPAFVIFNGPASYDKHKFGNDTVDEKRIYRLVLYIERAEFDTEGQPQLNTDYFFQAVRDYLLARPGLELDTEANPQIGVAFDAELLGDGGFSVGPYPLNASGPGVPQYVQIQWQLQIEELAQITYAD